MCYLYLGYEEEIDLPAHIVWHMPRYDDVDPSDLAAADKLFKTQMRFKGMGGYSLSPSARDPVYRQRHPGKSTAKVLMEAPAAWVKRYREDPSWRPEFEANVRENLLVLAHRHFPMLQGKTPKVVRTGVPVGCNPRAWGGCSLGIEPSGEHFTRDTHWLRPKTPIPGLWLTGQDSLSAGICGSMMSGATTYAAMTGDYFFLLNPRL
jgi:all-trans-retinol 13,14-reductase